MSYHAWHNYGYGICVDKIKVNSVEKMELLLSQAPKYQQEIHNWFEECEITEPAINDYMEFDQDFYLGVATILKEVIKEAEGIEFLACDDFDGIDFLIFEPLYPWQMSAKDLLITEEKINQILQKYVSILTDDGIIIEYQEIENGG